MIFFSPFMVKVKKFNQLSAQFAPAQEIKFFWWWRLFR